MFEVQEESPVPERLAVVFRRPTRVTGAITLSRLKAWESGIAPNDLDLFFKSHHLRQDGSESVKSECYAKILYRRVWMDYSHTEKVPRGILDTAADLLSLSSVNWCGREMVLPLSEIQDLPIVQKLYAIRVVWDKMIKDLNHTTTQCPIYSIPKFNLKFHFHGDYCVYEDSHGKAAMTWLMLIAFQDSLTGLFDCCVFSYLSDHEHGQNTFQSVSQMVVDGITSVVDLGPDVYDILKSFGHS